MRNSAFGPSSRSRGGARIALGDLNGDGIADLAIGAGFGGGPRVQLIRGEKAINGFPAQPTAADKFLNDVFIFDSALRDGSFLAIGDVNGDGLNELIASPGDGGPLQVKVLNAKELIADGNVDNTLARFTPSGLGGDGSGARVGVAATGNGSQVNVVVGTGKRTNGVAKVYPGTSFTGTLGSSLNTEPTGGSVLFNSGNALADGVYVG